MSLTRSKYNVLRTRLAHAAGSRATQEDRVRICTVLHWREQPAEARARIMADDLGHVLAVVRHIGNATPGEITEVLTPSFSPVCGEIRLQGLVAKAVAEHHATAPADVTELRRAILELADAAAFFGMPPDQLAPYRALAKAESGALAKGGTPC